MATEGRIQDVTDLAREWSEEGRAVFSAFLKRLDKDKELGGLPGFLRTLRLQGREDDVASWIAGPAPRPLPPEAVERALGAEELSTLAGEAGVPPLEAARELSRALPALVGCLSPGGRWEDDTAAEGITLLREALSGDEDLEARQSSSMGVD